MVVAEAAAKVVAASESDQVRLRDMAATFIPSIQYNLLCRSAQALGSIHDLRCPRSRRVKARYSAQRRRPKPASLFIHSLFCIPACTFPGIVTIGSTTLPSTSLTLPSLQPLADKLSVSNVASR